MKPQKPLILLVDDQPTNLSMLAAVLGDEYELKIATSGETALEIAHLQDQPDLILLDIVMPGMDGYEVCSKLKQSEVTRKIPLIFLTAKHEQKDEEHGLNLGAVDYITKPFTAPILRARVKTHILLKRNTDLLEMIAFLDGLTGIANRRKFDETLTVEWRRARRNQTSLALIMADIDFFKQFNDYYGHGAGDQCLREIAQTIASLLCREGDLAARYGGEEFVVILPETEINGAQKVAERLLRQVADLKIPHQSSSVSNYTTISLGVCAMVPGDEESETVLLELADKMLYQAKNLGRNRVSACSVSKNNIRESVQGKLS